ncbi:hypothetical protein [Galbibacter sp. PAP.153]|uniref:hypothetical protein n=1 Tax=Galbibacter sp. PAP.153 TaxID=3104623 RepID=UPI00300BA11A
MHKLIIFILLFSVVKGFGQELEFNPKKDHPYSFETEFLILKESVIELALKTDIEATFLKDDASFNMKVNRFQLNSMGFNIDSRNPKSLGRDSTKIRQLTSKPFIFQIDEGTMKLVSHKNMEDANKVQDILKELGKYCNPTYNKLYKDIVLKKGYSWSTTDSISSKLLDAKAQPVTFHYTVENINRKEVIIYGKSTLEEKHGTIYMAVKYILDKKTGIPLYTKYISYGDDVITLMINKAENYEAPNMYDEYMAIEPALNYLSYMKYSNLGFDPITYTYKKNPLTTDKEKLEKIIGQSLDSLTIDSPGLSNMYFLSGYRNKNAAVLDSLLTGTYAEVNAIRFIDKNGETMNIKPNTNIKYYTPMYMGPYHPGLYQKEKESMVAKVKLDITTNSPTKRETVHLTSSVEEDADYHFKLSDSTAIISFKNYLNIDYKSFRFYDKDGNELTAEWVPNYMNESFIVSHDAFTQKFIEQVPGEKKILYSMKFIVKNAIKMTFDVLTGDIKFRYKKTISKKHS